MAQKQQNQKIESTEEKFNRLRSVWLSDTQHISAISTMVNHPAYKEILKMGDEVLPFIIKDMYEGDVFWFHAVTELTGDTPEIPNYVRGRMKLIKDLYLAWYEDREEKRKMLRDVVKRIERERRGRS